ncbi:MAG: glycosyltransferase family 2 protein [Lachnospiraceae bacterium]|nr:glycosyltransferase family 2 protein [Lachnospiraceae bacterium]
MKLSVIVTVYNRKDDVGPCLDSILSQNYPDMELIVVDDGSQDGSGDVIAAYVERYPDRVVPLFQENAGVACARNLGLSAAKGEFVTYVDSDDIIPEGAFAAIDAELDRGGYDILMFDATACYPDGRRERFAPFYDGLSGVEGGELTPQQYILATPCPWNKWIRRSLYTEVFGSEPPFPEGLRYEDLAAIPVLALKAGKIGYLTVPCYDYVQSDISIMRTPGYSPHFADIFSVSLRLQKLLGQIWPKEVEYLFFEHVLVSGGKRYLACGKKAGFHRCADVMRQSYPDWQDNEYVKREPFKKRMLAKLIYQKQFNLLKMLGK